MIIIFQFYSRMKESLHEIAFQYSQNYNSDVCNSLPQIILSTKRLTASSYFLISIQLAPQSASLSLPNFTLHVYSIAVAIYNSTFT